MPQALELEALQSVWSYTRHLGVHSVIAGYTMLWQMSKRGVRWNGARLCQKNSRMDSQNLHGTIHYWECNMGLLVWLQYKAAMVCLGAVQVGIGSTGKRMAASCFTICGYFGHCTPWRQVYWHHFWPVHAPVLACSRCLRSCARAIQRYGYSRMLHQDSALQHSASAEADVLAGEGVLLMPCTCIPPVISSSCAPRNGYGELPSQESFRATEGTDKFIWVLEWMSWFLKSDCQCHSMWHFGGGVFQKQR